MDSSAQIPVLRDAGQPVVETADVDALAREVYQQNQKSIVKIVVTSPGGSTFGGSGVLVKEGNNVEIVTNAHVGANASSIAFTNAAGESFAARLDKFDDTDDLAVLKPDGVKIDPSRAVDIGDPSKLTPGQMLYAMGHPRGYSQPVLSEGAFGQLGTYASIAPNNGALIRGVANGLYKGNKAYVKDGEEFVNSPRVDAGVAADHGDSGGGLFDKTGKLMGIVESGEDDNQINTMSVSAGRVKALLDDPNYKFQFHYQNQSLASQSPLATTVKGIGLAGLAASKDTQRIAAPLVGIYYGVQALDDARMLSHDDLYDSRSHYWGKLAADSGAFAAGMLSFVPRLRLAASCLVAARLAVDAVTDFSQTKPVLDHVRRTDGSKGEPLFWSAYHH
jgi:hypothetical protein